MDNAPTQKQMDFIAKLCEKLGYEMTIVMREVKTKQDASKWIDKLKEECGMR